MRIRALWEGKTKDPRLCALINDYAARIAKFGDFVIEEIPETKKRDRNNFKKLSAAEARMLEKLRQSTKVFLDPQGCEWTSQEFALWLGQQGVRGTRELAFVVGGPDGFSSAFRAEADLLLSVSRMTLTHDWARALLLEQIYRGFTILRGFPYAH
ncbi:MAG: 23S rRNA (pseudouridine(1915)-N(3))-methyltransferase RlmH [Acidobacteria bacterium]|nr:23S rRNA (pseudouridine(1915)-N(3))-methyltransferase RlmH [Acidobacteriota bacterium]